MAGKKAKYDRYKSQNRKEKNQIRNLTRYLKDNPNDQQAANRLKAVQETIK